MNVAKMLGMRKCESGMKVRLVARSYGDQDRVEYGVLERRHSYYWRVRTLNGNSLNPRYWVKMERVNDMEYDKQRLLSEV